MYLGKPKTPTMKYLMTLMMTVLMVATATAQEKKGAMTDLKSRAEVMTKQMTQQLGLDAEQARKVQGINVKYAEKITPLPSEKATAEAPMDKATATNELNEDLKAVLTPEQYEQWLKVQAGISTKTPDGHKINAVQEVE